MFAVLRKYSLLHAAFFRASFTADIEYRVNFALRIFTDVIWYVAQAAVFEVIYLQTPVLGTWTRDMTRIFLGILFISDGIFSLIFSANLDHFSEQVRRGDLDLLLAKPVNSQFMMSCQRVSTTFVFNIAIGVAWFAWSVANYSESIPWWRFLWLVLLIPCGVMMTYALRFFFAAMTLIVVRAENLQYLWYNFFRLGTRPDSIYPIWLRYLLISALPVAFIASVPARVLLEPTSPSLILLGLAMTGFFFWLSTRFWAYALSFYASASS